MALHRRLTVGVKRHFNMALHTLGSQPREKMLRRLALSVRPAAAALLRPHSLVRFAACSATAATAATLTHAATIAEAQPITSPRATEATYSPEQWNAMITAALPAVVSIKVNRVRAFDTSWSTRSVATS